MYIHLMPKSHFSHILSRELKPREEGHPMPPRQGPPMMGPRRGMNQPNPFMMQRPQRIPNMPVRNFPSVRSGRRSLGGRRGSGNGLLSRITGNQGPANRGAGGLLSRLLGSASGGAGNMATGFEGAARGGLLQSVSQPNGLVNFLNQTQNVLQAASQIQPLIEQYGPLVRNLPAMWKLYRSLKSDSNDESKEDDETKEEIIEKDTVKQSKSVKQSKKKSKKKPKKKNKTRRSKKGSSRNPGPKLYV